MCVTLASLWTPIDYKKLENIFRMLNGIPKNVTSIVWKDTHFYYIIKDGHQLYVRLKSEKRYRKSAGDLFQPSFWNCQ